MEKKIGKEIRKRSLIFILILFGIIYLHTAVKAAGIELSEASDGIVEIRISYQDESGRTYLIREGIGFLIGDPQTVQSVITCQSLVVVDNDVLDKLRKDNSIGEAERLTEKIELIAANDVTVDADVKIDSSDLNCVVLSLASPVYHKKGLRLSGLGTTQAGQNVYVLDLKRESGGVELSAGTIQEAEQKINQARYIRHTAKITSDYYGSPLLNEKGDVIGINIGSDENGYGLAVSAGSLREVLDVMGIPYSNADSELSVQVLLDTIAESQRFTDREELYTKRSIKRLQGAVAAARELLETQESDGMNYEKAAAAIEEAQQQLVTMEEKVFPLQVGLGLLLLLLLSLDLIMIVKRKKQKRKPNYLYEEQSQETDYDSTVVLERSAVIPKAYLVKMNSDRRIPVNKLVFRIGKAKGQVDFAIVDNPSISRHHADIVCENGFFFIIDRNSLNHTMVNEEVLLPDKKKAVRNRDKIKFADEEYLFEIKE